MPIPTHRLVYYSRNLIGAGEFDAALTGILAVSRRNNARAGITGALLFSQGGFGQVLEGPRPAVEMTFERIQQDSRHEDVLLLAFEEIRQRSFPDWSMCYHGPDDEGDSCLPSYASIGTGNGFDPRQMTADRILETLMQLTRSEIGAA